MAKNTDTTKVEPSIESRVTRIEALMRMILKELSEKFGMQIKHKDGFSRPLALIGIAISMTACIAFAANLTLWDIGSTTGANKGACTAVSDGTYITLTVDKISAKSVSSTNIVATSMSAADLTAGTTASAINGASITSLTGANLTGNIALARITNALSTSGSSIGGNIPVASLTNAVTQLSGTLVTNTCIAADGKTNTYIFVPFGGCYVLKSITTSP